MKKNMSVKRSQLIEVLKECRNIIANSDSDLQANELKEILFLFEKFHSEKDWNGYKHIKRFRFIDFEISFYSTQCADFEQGLNSICFSYDGTEFGVSSKRDIDKAINFLEI